MMPLKNTTLDDVAAVIGFTAALRICAWYSETNLFVPVKAEAGQMLVQLLGMSLAKRMSEEWPGEWVSIPRLTQYEHDYRRKQITDLVVSGWGPRKIGHFLRMTDARVMQIIRELESEGVIKALQGVSVVEALPKDGIVVPANPVAKHPLKRPVQKVRLKNQHSQPKMPSKKRGQKVGVKSGD